MSSLYILEFNPMSVALFVNIFSHFVGCLFILLIIAFDAQNVYILVKSSLFFVVVVACAVGIIFKKA